jgi:nucleotide-binding universal stress UspA family protein
MEVVPVSFSTLVIVMAAVWLSVGLTLSLVMGRRGHDAFGWLILGTLFGPLGAILAVEARGEERARPEMVAPPQSDRVGPVDVLVGVDGSPESAAALAAATALLGPSLGRLTLATVIPYDSGVARQRTARAELERLGGTVDSGPELELLHGRAGPALLEHAAVGGYDMLVIGTRGAGASKALLGSTAADIAESAKLPVLLMGSDGAGRRS